MGFNNYLLQLVDENDTIGNSLYLYDIGHIINSLWNEIIKTKKKVNIRKLVPEVFGLEPTYLYAIMKNKRGISIQSAYKLLKLWETFCNKQDNEITKQWNNIHNICKISSFSKPEKIILPKSLTPSLSYLIGFIVGDGCFDSYGSHYRIKISEQKIEQLDFLKNIIVKIFGVKCLIRNEGSNRQKSNFLIINSKPVFRFLTKVLRIKVGEVPKFIKQSDIENKKYFMRGIFDADGSVDPKYIRCRIRLFQKSSDLLRDIINMLKEVEISANGPYNQMKKPSKNFPYFSEWFTIEIRKKSEILKFIREIGSSHVEKAPKMKFLEKEIYNRYKYTLYN